MKKIILGIETSCDETAVSILEAQGNFDSPDFNVLGNALYSQVKIHAEFGGVFPMVAKREHGLNLVPLFEQALKEAKMFEQKDAAHAREGISKEKRQTLEKILEREQQLLPLFLDFVPRLQKPNIDVIAITNGPGLEPALWVGISFAKALSYLWDIPLIAVNHMEGHIFSPLVSTNTSMDFPALSLLISGGHTELVLIESWHSYKVIGQTRDDAVGEAFDKVARMLGLPYPGGPHISRLAAENRSEKTEKISTRPFILPRPMIKSDDYDFSFSGLKTAVLYALQKLPSLSDNDKKEFAEEFENAVTEVLVTKTKRAMEEYSIKTLILGGGVVSNSHIKEEFRKMTEQFPDSQLLLPTADLSTDNAIMIAAAGYFSLLKQPQTINIEREIISAKGNLSL